MIRYIIVDDEPIAHRVIESYAQHLPELQKVGNCYDALELLQMLKNTSVHLLFLDINMPKLSGFELLNTLEKPPQIIITTAYRDHALQGYDYNVSDFLLKPFSFERFLKAVNKIILPASSDWKKEEKSSNTKAQIFIRSDKKLHQIYIHDILWIEALGNYSKIVLEKESIVTLQKISDLERKLPGNFIRVHKSYLLAKERIRLIEGNRIHIGEHKIPIGQTYRSTIKKLISL